MSHTGPSWSPARDLAAAALAAALAVAAWFAGSFALTPATSPPAAAPQLVAALRHGLDERPAEGTDRRSEAHLAAAAQRLVIERTGPIEPLDSRDTPTMSGYRIRTTGAVLDPGNVVGWPRPVDHLDVWLDGHEVREYRFVSRPDAAGTIHVIRVCPLTEGCPTLAPAEGEIDAEFAFRMGTRGDLRT